MKLLNSVKLSQTYPTIFQPSNISSFWKKKGDKSDLDNDRGVFNVTKIRSILDKMVYNDVYETIDSSMSCSNIGARKNRNIRDHLFVINGILNEVINDKDHKPVDIQIYDVAKCFDKLDYVNTANDLYNAGVQDDKFTLVANSNMNCNVAVKTPWGTTTERTMLHNIEMQGTVLAPLKCSISIDSIGRETLENVHDVLYKYKSCISIPPLSLIDDVISVSRCSTDSVKMNAIIESKISGMQLELGHKKCFQLHVGKNTSCCPTLNVNSKEMLTSSQEKYLGDVLSSDGKITQNVLERYNKGVGIVNQIISMLKEVYFGYHYFEMALMFRSSMLINGILCSIESLYGLTDGHIEQLEQCDRMLMRQLFSSVSTTAIEAFYYETGTLPLRFTIIARRLMYLWCILQKPENELVKQVYTAQKISPVQKDWYLKIQDDLNYCNIALSEDEIKSMKQEKFRNLVVKNVKEVGRNYLLTLKNRHSKSSGLDEDFKLQSYLTSDKLILEEKQLLFQFRTQTYNCKSNFRKRYEPDLSCFVCKAEDTQQHLLTCNVADDVDTENIEYEDIFKSVENQVKLAKILKKIHSKRTLLLKKSSTTGSQVHS